MSAPPSKTDDARRIELSPEDLRALVGRVRRLPEARMEKVAAVRRALHRHTYDRDEMLEVTLERLGDDLGLCTC